MTSPFDDLSIDHARFYVEDLTATTDWLVDGYGLQIEATAPGITVVRRGDIQLVLEQPAAAGDHPGAVFLDRHGDGVADLALRVADVSAAYSEAVGRGAEPVRPPGIADGRLSATIRAFGDVTHTFVQPVEKPAAALTGGWDSGLREVDHIAVCLEGGQLEPTVEFYKTALGFDKIFEEYITVGEQAMNSAVVQSGSGRVTLTLLEPDRSRMPGQIDEFLKNNGGSGVQHLALSTLDIVATVGSITATGVEFLKSPASYYRMLGDRLQLARHTVAELQDLSILADQDHDGQLYQIFASSVNPRHTFFMEVIERLGASTFGSNNIKALYEAVEAERNQLYT